MKSLKKDIVKLNFTLLFYSRFMRYKDTLLQRDCRTFSFYEILEDEYILKLLFNEFNESCDCIMENNSRLAGLFWPRSGAGQQSMTKKFVYGVRNFFYKFRKIHSLVTSF